MLEHRIEQFCHTLENSVSTFYKVESYAPYAYQIRPQTAQGFDEGLAAITLMAITHGNEFAGIGVLTRLAKLLLGDQLWFPYPVNLILGNPEAARAGKRYLEHDLNRAFLAPENASTLEHDRAREISSLLESSRFFLDFHQTIEASASPFFIFPYEPKCYEFARQINVELPIVTHWGKGFSKDGSCTDEFVNRKGGCGISVELGQKGFDLAQESVGFYLALETLRVVSLRLQNKELEIPQEMSPIYTFAEVLPYPDASAQLDEGWYNFKEVTKGQKLGRASEGDIIAPISGPILFPKYRRSDSGHAIPKEICRILKRVEEDALGS